MYNIELKIDTNAQIIVHTVDLNHSDKVKALQASRTEVNAILSHYFSREIRYEKDEHKRPFVPHFNGGISISHSKILCGVYISGNKQVGIDIQHIDARILDVVPKFINEAELPFLNKSESYISPDEMATIIWCIKECLYKKYAEKHLSLKQDMCVLRFDFSKNQAFVSVKGQEEKIAFMRLSGYIVGYTL